MSLEFFNPSASISRTFSRQFWEMTLQLAQGYGWKPQGTYLPSEAGAHDRLGWLGSYLTNDGQIVLAEDARALVQALEKALDDIPDTNMEMDWDCRAWLEDDLPEWLSPEEQALIEDGLEEHSHDVLGLHPFQFFAGDAKQHLTRLMRFCRLGSFMIM